MWCPGCEEDCDAEQDACLCGVLRCVEHGHVDEGDDPWCRWWVEDPRGRRWWSRGEVEEEPIIENLDLSSGPPPCAPPAVIRGMSTAADLPTLWRPPGATISLRGIPT